MASSSFTKPSLKLLAGVATTALSLGLVATASAQNSQLDPTFGTVSEGQGFGSVSQTIQAGGDIDASSLASGCNGFIADAPDLILDYSGDAPVLIEGRSDADTTMVVEAPDGQILCNDDFDGLNPGIETSSGEPGRYAVWIGTYEPIQNNTYPDADIVLTESQATTQPVAPAPGGTATGFNANQAPTFGELEVDAAFGSQSFTLQAGGLVDAFETNQACAGFVADVPDYQLTIAPGMNSPIDLAVTSDVDTTLIVVAPNGSVLCNDDAVDLNPGLQISNPQAGSYAVWVGTFGPIENDFYPEAVLNISTNGAVIAPQPGGSGFNANQPPTFGEIAVTTGFGSQTFTLQAGGDVDAFAANNACAGFVADVPDYVINYQGGSRGPLDLGVESAEDTTLVVVGPNGQVYCNDDDLDLNPALSIASPAAGNYGVWVGTFNPIQNDFFPDATLTITAGPGGDSGSISPGGLGDRLRLAPTFGSTQLGAGFRSHSIDLQAGGAMDGTTLGQFCNGFVAEAPDYVVTYNGGQALRITATSEEDTTMAVALPNGQIQCNDDFSGLNPGLIGPEGLSGDYAVWIGTFNPIENDTFPPATLRVEEVSTTKVQPSGAVTSMSLTAGFTPDPFTTVLAAGGVVDAGTVDPGCWGNIASEPDFVLNYTSGDWPLRVFVNSDADTTLLVRTPTGEVLCNDDTDGLNPAVSMTDPSSGRYEVFIGTYDPSAGNPEATLAISEILDEKILPDGAVTEAAITGGMTRQEFELLAGGSFEAFNTFGGTCNGFIASNPDFIAYVDDAGLDVEMTVRSAEDTTLAVRAPNGTVLCDDDSGGDFNPLVLIDGAQTGAYEVWLGTFSSVGNAPATLSVRDVNAASGTAPNVPGGGKK